MEVDASGTSVNCHGKGPAAAAAGDGSGEPSFAEALQTDGKAMLLSPVINSGMAEEIERQAAEEKKADDFRVLAITYAVLFSRYAIATFLSAFFPTYAEDIGISGTFSGLIFAAYPLGITITSALGTRWMRRLGMKRCIVIGMLNTTAFTFLFGGTPAACGFLRLGQGVQPYLFLLFYFLGGLGGAIAETACIMMANYRFRENSATVSASIGTVCGIGCMVGPPLGGVLYDFGKYTAFGSFFFPFFVFSAIPFLITASLPCTLPGVELASEAPSETSSVVNGDGQEPGSVLSQLYGAMTKSRAVTLLGMGINGAIVASLDPTLAYRLADDPIGYSSTMVGLVFMASSVSYTAMSIPCGYVLDSYKGKSSVFKSVQASAFVALFLCFAMLGPIVISGSKALFNNVPAVWIAMLLKGVGSTGNNAAYPDLIIGVSDDDVKMHETISGIWNATYAIGWALGPLFGGALYQAIGFAGYATVNAVLAGSSSALLFTSAVPTISRYLNEKNRSAYGFQPLQQQQHLGEDP